MSLDIFFLNDICNAILAANEGGNPSFEQVKAILASSHWSGELVEMAYKAGHTAALKTLALAFGLSPSIITEGQQVVKLLDNQPEM